jgi:hypothetical protein
MNFIKTNLFATFMLVAACLSAQNDPPSTPTYRWRTYFVLNHAITPYQPTAIIGSEFRPKGPHAITLEGAYLYSIAQDPPTHGYRIRTSYRYYFSQRDPKSDPKYLSIMVGWQQRFQRTSGWYNRFDGRYQEYLTGSRTWNAIRFNAGIGFLIWGKKKRFVEFLIAPGVRWLRRTAYDFPPDVRTGDNIVDIRDNTLLLLPDLTFHFSFGKAR